MKEVKVAREPNKMRKKYHALKSCNKLSVENNSTLTLHFSLWVSLRDNLLQDIIDIYIYIY